MLRPSRRRAAQLTAAAALSSLALATASPAATDPAVQIVYRAYQPSSLTVLAGQTVTWRNSGLGMHTVTADAGQFDSGTLQSGATFSYTFSTPGTLSYSCTIHPTMHGRVVVLGALPAGFPAGDSLNAVLVRLSSKHDATLVHVLAARPGAAALLQLQSSGGSSWTTKLRARLSTAGVTTFNLAANVHRRVRVVVRAAGEAPLISRAVRPSA